LSLKVRIALVRGKWLARVHPQCRGQMLGGRRRCADYHVSSLRPLGWSRRCDCVLGCYGPFAGSVQAANRKDDLPCWYKPAPGIQGSAYALQQRLAQRRCIPLWGMPTRTHRAGWRNYKVLSFGPEMSTNASQVEKCIESHQFPPATAMAARLPGRVGTGLHPHAACCTNFKAPLKPMCPPQPTGPTCLTLQWAIPVY